MWHVRSHFQTRLVYQGGFKTCVSLNKAQKWTTSKHVEEMVLQSPPFHENDEGAFIYMKLNF